MRRIYVAIAAALAVSAAVAIGVSAVSASPSQVYTNPNAPIPARVRDLLKRMTLAEKVGQMDQIVVGNAAGRDRPPNGSLQQATTPINAAAELCMQKVLITDDTGSVLSGGTDNPPGNTGNGLGEAVQHRPAVRDRSLASAHPDHLRGRRRARLRAPDRRRRCSRSRSAWARPGTPSSRARPAPPRAASCAAPAPCGTSLRSRTPRATTAGAATTRPGARSPRCRARSARPTSPACRASARSGQSVAATVKHFAGYSESINGHDRVEEQLPIRYLQDQFMPSYAAGINAGADTVMVNSGSINGVPATASHFLLDHRAAPAARASRAW